jgi:hypothetical protein
MSAICAALACFFLGIALSCAGVSARARLIVHESGAAGSRFCAFCVTMSFAAVFAALAAVSLESFDSLRPGAGTLFYYAVFAALGIAAGVWYRVALPVIILLYGCYAVLSVVPPVRNFSGASRALYNIRIDSESAIVINGGRFEFAEDSDGFALMFETYTLPARRLVPFYSSVFRLAGAVPRGAENPAGEDASPMKARAANGLSASRAEVFYEIPGAEIYPVEYALDCRIKNGAMIFDLRRVF